MVHVVIAVSPFRQERKIFNVEDGTSIAEILETAGFQLSIPARIFINDRLVADEERQSNFAQNHDLVTIRLLPRGAAIAALLLAISSGGLFSALSGAVSGVMSGITGIFGGLTFGKVLMTGIGLVGNLIMKALVPPPHPSKPNISSVPASFTISGQSNQSTPYAPVPRVFGTRKVMPILAAQAYTEVVGNDQYLRMVLSAGYGPLVLRRLKIAQTALETFQNVEWEIRHGYPDDAPLQLYSNECNEQNLNILLLDTANKNTTGTDWQSQTTAVDTEEIAVDITHPQGLQTINDVGNHRQLWVNYQLRYTVHGTPNFIYLKANGQPTSNTDFIQDIGVTGAIVRRSIRWHVAKNQYDVQLKVIGIGWKPNSNVLDTFFGTTYWTSLRSFKHSDPVHMSGVSKIALRIKASNQLTGVISQLSCIANSVVRDFDSSLGSWETRAGSWDYDFFKWANPTFSIGSGAETYTGTGHCLKINIPTANDGSYVASQPIPILGWAERTLCLTALVKASKAVSPFRLGIFLGSDDTFQFHGHPAWLPNHAYQVGDIITPTTAQNNQGPWTAWKVVGPGYTYRCVRAGTSGGAPPVFTQTIGNMVKDGVDPGLQWENIGGPTAGILSVYDGAIGTSWKAIIQDIKIPYPTPLPADAFSTYYPGDVATWKGLTYLCLKQTTGTTIGNAAYWQLLPHSALLDHVNYLRVVIQCPPSASMAGATVFCDAFKLEMRPSLRQILPNPSFDYLGSITSNPASHYREVLQGSANKRPCADSRLDLTALQTWHTYARSNGYMHNGIYDKPSTVFETLRTIAAVGRAGFFQKDDLYSVILDRPQTTPVQHFTPRNSWNFKSTKAFPDLPQALRVRYANMLKDYQIDEIIVYDDGYNAGNTTRFELLDEAAGVAAPVFDFNTGQATPGSQPWRDGRYHLAQARLRPETYELTADFENIVCTRGDLVYVVHDVPQWGRGFGRITALNIDYGRRIVLGCTVDDRVFGDGVHQCVIRVRTPEANSKLINVGIIPIAGTNQLTFTSLVNDARVCAVGSLFMFGFLNQESVQLLVTAIEPHEDLTATLYLQDYAPAVYSAEQSGQPPYLSSIGGSLVVVSSPKIIAVRSDLTVMAKDTQRSWN